MFWDLVSLVMRVQHPVESVLRRLLGALRLALALLVLHLGATYLAAAAAAAAASAVKVEQAVLMAAVAGEAAEVSMAHLQKQAGLAQMVLLW